LRNSWPCKGENMAIENWKDALTKVLKTIDGIADVRAYDDLPGQIVASPTLLWFPESGTQNYGMGSPAVAYHRVRLSLLVSVTLLPEGVGTAVPLIAAVRNVLAQNLQLGGAVTQIIPPTEGNFYEGPAAMEYGDRMFTGINLYYVVKEVEQIAVARG
jgi:hypothetical protein